MSNVLFINISDVNVEFSLVSQLAKENQNTYITKKLYEYVGKGFGHKIIEAELASEFTKSNGNNCVLEKHLTKYYECILVGKTYDIQNAANINIAHQFQELLINAKSLAQSNEHNLLEKTGLIKRFIDLLKRVQFDTIQFHIDLIEVYGNLYSDIILASIQKIYSNIPIRKMNEDLPSFVYRDAPVDEKRLLSLRYLNKIEPVMEINKGQNQEGTFLFKTRFSLDTSVHIELIESWREMGINKERSITTYSFNLPFFYTGDDILLTISYQHQPKSLYLFELAHVVSGEKETFYG
jgi:hypothetical protein